MANIGHTFATRRPLRIATIVTFFVMIAGLCAYGTAAWLLRRPQNINFVDFTAGHRVGTPVNLTIQTVGTMGKGYHNPGWVSYWVKAPDGKWIHSTLWQLPAHTRINVTELEYDSGVVLRNEVFGRVTGTIGGDMTVNGKKMSLITSKTGYGETHTFTVPGMGINVPFLGVNGNSSTFCTQSPCTPNHVHNVIKFSFMTGAPGQYHWQCFYPCAGGFLDGNGGPMQTLGYMDGFLKVEPTGPGEHLVPGE